MNRTAPFRRTVPIAALAFLPLLAAGCGTARGIINSQIPAIRDPARLDGKQFPAVVGDGGAAQGTFTGPFADQGRVSNQDRLNFAELRQTLRPEVSLLPPSGSGVVTPPATVTLSALELRVRVYEGASQDAAPTREVVFPVLADGDAPLTFENVAGTNRYTLPGAESVLLGPSRISGADARRLFAVLTDPAQDGSTTNFVQASFSANVEGSALPAGATVLFTFGPGEARVGL